MKALVKSMTTLCPSHRPSLAQIRCSAVFGPSAAEAEEQDEGDHTLGQGVEQEQCEHNFGFCDKDVVVAAFMVGAGILGVVFWFMDNQLSEVPRGPCLADVWFVLAVVSLAIATRMTTVWEQRPKQLVADLECGEICDYADSEIRMFDVAYKAATG